MAGIIENFKLDMADEHDISFADAGKVISLIIDVWKETRPGIARQELVNGFAKLIAGEYAYAEDFFLRTADNQDQIRIWLAEKKQARADRAFERSLKNLERFILQLMKG